MLARSRSRKVVALARQIRDLAHDGPRAVSDSCAENQPGEAAIDESSTQEEQWLTAPPGMAQWASGANNGICPRICVR